MTSISAGHIILTPTQPVGSGWPQRGLNPGPPHQELRALPTEILQIKLNDKLPHRDIRKQTNFKDVQKHIGKQKWRWTGHVGRMHDNRWTKRCTEWQSREGRRNRGRPARRWRDDIEVTAGKTWMRKTQDREEWRRLSEGYVLQWTDNAYK